jgi:hypothetical protein
MTAEDIPYQLRPNKFIDREVFVDLLCRLVPAIGADRYIYFSMGGKHLVDHVAVYRHVGITRLFSFDVNPLLVGRQKFNRPIDSAMCDELAASALPTKIDAMADLFPGATNVVVWLDYTDPHNRLAQLQELVEVAKRLQPGDILRITLNANLGTLDGKSGSAFWKDEGFETLPLYRAAKLKGVLGDFVPEDVKAIGEDDFPAILGRCVGLALSKAEAEKAALSYRPILLTTYRDGQRMVSATCVALPRADIEKEIAVLRSWPFLPANWGDVVRISAPDLSLREKLKIDESLSSAPDAVLESLGFLLSTNKERSIEAIESYQKMHRYYPSFHHIDS